MRYLLALLLPPLAVLSVGRPFQALLNVPLLLLGWIPAVVHACLLVHSFEEDRRAHEIVNAVRGRA